MGTTKTYGLGGGVAGTSEIEDNTDDAVLWKDTAGIEMFELDTTNGSGYVAISADTDASNGKPYLKLNESGNYVELTTNGYARILGSANNLYTYAANKYEMLQSGTTSWRIRLADESNFDLLVIDGDASNFTFTFQTADSGVFKVSDSSGVDYLNIAEGGVSTFGHSTDSTATQLRGSSVQLKPSDESLFSAAANGTARYLGLNPSGTLHAVTHWGTKQDYTVNTSEGDEKLKCNRTYELAASGPSGDVTVDADFLTEVGLYTTEVQATHESSITVANSNATHDFIFKFNVKSGNGTVAPFDSDATNLTDGTGYTCGPGKIARFKIETVRIGGTGVSNQVHMVRCIGKN